MESTKPSAVPPGHRHPDPQGRQEHRQRHRQASRAGLGPRAAPQLVAPGGVVLLGQAVRPGRTYAQENGPGQRSRTRPARTPRFVKTQTDGLVLDEAALARARRLAGLKGLVTNIPATVLPAAEVISSYADLWHVEHSFRMSKSDLRARPLFARRRDSIEAHLTIVFTALAIGRTVQDRTGLSLRRVLRQLRPLRSATIQANGALSRPATSPRRPTSTPPGRQAKPSCPRSTRLPNRALAQDLVHQPPRAVEQGDQTPRPRRRDLPQRGLRGG